MSDYQKKFPELYQLLGGFFHQDWVHVFDWKDQSPTFEGVIRYYKNKAKQGSINQDVKELKVFLSLGLSESEVEDVMDEWSVAYYPYGRKITYNKWLQSILDVLEEPVEKTKQEFIPEFIG